MNKILSLCSMAGVLVASGADQTPEDPSAFVTVKGAQFHRLGKPYCFLGVNYWQGMNLGSPGEGGDRARLRRELDQMKKLGMTNLRILALSEGPDGSPYRVLPAVQNVPGKLDEALLKGLDFLLDEMRKREMTAVVVFNNFWPWSGGMAQYCEWNGAGPIPYPPPHPGGTWDGYQKFTASFYGNAKAVQQNRSAIEKIVTRKNTVNGRSYSDDPTIMAWELCNEPRGINQQEKMNQWIDDTASFIKKLDPKHLVTTGAEGYTSSPESAGTDFIKMHDGKNIDYTTAHVWIQNWGWYDPQKHDKTYAGAKEKMLSYLAKHGEESKKLGKPFVLEEFGIMKDGGSFDPAATTTNRDAYYEAVFQAVLDYMGKGEASGVNFWAWAGEGRPRVPGTMWKKGDVLTGDPPHEPQGWYSVYDTDTATHQVISKYTAKINKLNR